MKPNEDITLPYNSKKMDNLTMDMDLIDILWLQDIDLGVSREMFESDLWQEQEKEFNKDPNEKDDKEGEKENNSYPQLDLSGNYVVDNETGELVPVTPSILSSNISELLAPSSATFTGQSFNPASQVNNHETTQDEESGEFCENVHDVRGSREDYVSADGLMRQNSSVSDFAAIPYLSLNGIDQSWEDVFSFINEQDSTFESTELPRADNPALTFIHPSEQTPFHDSTLTFVNHQQQPMAHQPTSHFQQNPSIFFAQEPTLPLIDQQQASLYNHSADTFNLNATFSNQSMFPIFSDGINTNEKEMSETFPQYVADGPTFDYQQSTNETLVQNVPNTNDLPMMMMIQDPARFNNLSMIQSLRSVSVSAQDNQIYPPLLQHQSPLFNFSQDLHDINMDTTVISSYPRQSIVDVMSPTNQSFATPSVQLVHPGYVTRDANDLGEALTAAITYANNDSFIQELLQEDFNGLEFDDNFDEDASGLDLDGINGDWSAEPAVSSMESPKQLISSYQDGTVSEMDVVSITAGAEMREDVKYSTILYDHFNVNYNSAPSNTLPLEINLYSASSDTRPNVGSISPQPVFQNHAYFLQLDQRSKKEKQAEIKKENEDKAARSRDTKRAKALKLPFLIDDIIDLPVDEFTEMLTRYTLTEAQLQLVRDIRRRGKNKAAAQNCRKRKLEIIQSLEDEVEGLRRQRDQLTHTKHSLDSQAGQLKEKFNGLQADLLKSLRDASGRPYDPNEYSLQRTSDGDIILVPKSSIAESNNKLTTTTQKEKSIKDFTDKKQKQKRKE